VLGAEFAAAASDVVAMGDDGLSADSEKRLGSVGAASTCAEERAPAGVRIGVAEGVSAGDSLSDGVF
jgi:hypothetical protein